jgi:methylphosphotriester-DNA--protein-cysteine methyltransferase
VKEVLFAGYRACLKCRPSRAATTILRGWRP